MKWIIVLLLAVIVVSPACNLRQREEALRKKEVELKEKEQELLLKEKTLQIKEDELLQKEQKLDSTTLNDTTFIYNPNLIGLWSVKMICTETTCPGSAIGDTKNEQWQIAYQANKIIAKAMVGNQLVRVYSGTFKGNILELVDEQENGENNGTKISVRLRFTSENTMQGQREILRIGDCRILYSLQMNKE